MEIFYNIRNIMLVLLLASGCTATVPDTPDDGTDSPYGETRPVAGKLYVKVSEELSEEIEEATEDYTEVDVKAVKSMSGPASSIRISKLTRLFPYAGKFEARTRAEGLHRWYVVEYEDAPDTRSAAASMEIPGVDIVEIPQKIKKTWEAKAVPVTVRTEENGNAVFDDPMLQDQWHYYNTGQVPSSIGGCDINVTPIWENYTTGRPDVIVSVVDGGVDYSHEDLAANMWNNPDETGDRKYGFNFVTGTTKVTADDHGTHVAGTIAAVNNNGKGVCGIAGGDEKNGTEGVKIMSCQIFQGEESAEGAAAIKWGADHGAVISQNSWGYENITYTPQRDKDAIDYFVKYAGLDENGNQTGPMIGGVVIFAAGNENASVGFPASYENAIAVTSVGADYKRAYYSNYGDWTDIAAPGGDAKKGNQVLSTLPGNKYGLMQGTSMACPHVSGVAALIVSRFGGQGFTAEALKERLLAGTTVISGYNMSHHMGSGLVNAYAAIAGSGGTAPETPSDLKAEAVSNTITVSMTVPEDEDDRKPYSLIVYYSTEENPTAEGSMFGLFYVGDKNPGETVTGTIGGLEFNTTYRVAAVASDLAGNKSPETEWLLVETGSNNAPTITSLSGNSVSIKPHENAEFRFECEDPDGHFYYIELESDCATAVLDTTTRNLPTVRISGAGAASGKYQAELTVSDIYGASSSVRMECTVLENHSPQTAGKFEDMIFNSRTGETVSFDAGQYFTDEDGETLSYTIDISNTSVLNMVYAQGQFHLTTMNYGYCDITVTATDIRGETASQSFKVLVRDGEEDVDVYPNPVSDKLYLRTSTDTDVKYMITSSWGATALEGEAQVSPFSPHDIDVTGLDSGMYSISIRYDGKTLRKTFVKL